MHARMHARTHARTLARTHSRSHPHTHPHTTGGARQDFITHTHTNTQMRARTHTRTRAHTFTPHAAGGERVRHHARTHKHTHTNTHARTYTRTRTLAHVHTSCSWRRTGKTSSKLGRRRGSRCQHRLIISEYSLGMSFGSAGRSF